MGAEVPPRLGTQARGAASCPGLCLSSAKKSRVETKTLKIKTKDGINQLSLGRFPEHSGVGCVGDSLPVVLNDSCSTRVEEPAAAGSPSALSHPCHHRLQPDSASLVQYVPVKRILLHHFTKACSL